MFSTAYFLHSLLVNFPSLFEFPLPYIKLAKINPEYASLIRKLHQAPPNNPSPIHKPNLLGMPGHDLSQLGHKIKPRPAHLLQQHLILGNLHQQSSPLLMLLPILQELEVGLLAIGVELGIAPVEVFAGLGLGKSGGP
jgi:hypothetical protein